MAKLQRTFIGTKFYSMLCSGTVLMGLTALMGIADPLIAGILLGEEAVAGISLALPIYSLASFFAVSFSYGVPILYAGKTGAFRKDEADRCFGVGLSISCGLGLLLFLAMLLGTETYLKVFRISGQQYASADEYLRWMKYAVLLLPLNELLDGMVFADGDEKITLAANGTQGLLKVVLSVILCQRIGAKGLAIASLTSFAVSIGLSCLHFLRPGNTLRLNLAFSSTIVRSIVKLGLVDASTHLFVSLFSFCISFFISSFFGPEMLILASVISLLKEGQILFEGIGEAITPIISVYLGEETYPGVRKVWRLAKWSGRIESLVSTALLLIFAPSVVGLLDIGDPRTAEWAVQGLRMLSVTLIFTCRMFLDSSYFILVDRVPLGVLDTLLRELFPALPLAALGGVLAGVPGMFMGLTIAAPLGYVLSVVYVRLRYGRENYPLFIADRERRRKMFFFEFPVVPDHIVFVRDQIGKAMKDNACPDRLIQQVMLIFEELFMLIHDANPGRTVLAECAAEMGNPIHLVIKDNGRITDLTDLDRRLDSLRAYTLSGLLGKHSTRRLHLLALSYNHYALEIE